MHPINGQDNFSINHRIDNLTNDQKFRKKLGPLLSEVESYNSRSLPAKLFFSLIDGLRDFFSNIFSIRPSLSNRITKTVKENSPDLSINIIKEVVAQIFNNPTTIKQKMFDNARLSITENIDIIKELELPVGIFRVNDPQNEILARASKIKQGVLEIDLFSEIENILQDYLKNHVDEFGYRDLLEIDQLLESIPEQKKEIFNKLFSFLNVIKVKDNKVGHKMTAYNLAVVFAPNLFNKTTDMRKPIKFTEFLINQYHDLPSSF
jgi:hypothetical protein